jgi:hypothetical protein
MRKRQSLVPARKANKVLQEMVSSKADAGAVRQAIPGQSRRDRIGPIDAGAHRQARSRSHWGGNGKNANGNHA